MGDIVRKLKNGRFVGWYVRYRDLDGRRKQRASHQPTKALARRFLLEVEGRVARGAVGIPEPTPDAPTVADLCARWLGEYRNPKVKDLGRYRAHSAIGLRRLLPYLSKVRLSALGPREL